MTLVSIGLATTLSLLLPAQPPSAIASAPEFRVSSDRAKLALLNDLATFRASPAAEVVGEILTAGIQERDADIRAAALSAVAGRAAARRFLTSSERRAIANRERSYLLRLRPALLGATSDDSARVRRAAIVALVNLEYEPASSVNDVQLKSDVGSALRMRFDVENSPEVRAEIAKTFALTSLASEGR